MWVICTILREMTLQAIARAFSLGIDAAALRTSWMACRSLFLGVDMFKVGKMASPCYRIAFSDTQNRTLSSHPRLQPFVLPKGSDALASSARTAASRQRPPILLCRVLSHLIIDLASQIPAVMIIELCNLLQDVD